MSLVAGVDSSTQSCKVVVRDLSTGELVRQGTAKHPEGTEVPPDAWWEALVTAIAAAFWRGRRFGPLVVENLPVTVRASETTAGRARLYARAGDPVHALDQLRLGARDRIARALGLPAHAQPSEVADAAAARLNVDRADVRSILVDALPRNDHELVRLTVSLRDLEASVRAAARPERNTP